LKVEGGRWKVEVSRLWLVTGDRGQGTAGVESRVRVLGNSLAIMVKGPWVMGDGRRGVEG
jgi:hypothetical protein